ncbi:MAG: hypothetical protein GF330_02590 [Candidatus Eisenbacteria bacterium]|nr:hypothetical protein [Candidatus Eisenbacteria bacterium]
MLASFAGPYAVQCGSFRRESNATDLVERLRSQGLEARVHPVRIPERGVWHRVIIGGDADRTAAEALARRVVGAGWVSVAQVVARNGWGQAVPHPIRADETSPR